MNVLMHGIISTNELKTPAVLVAPRGMTETCKEASMFDILSQKRCNKCGETKSITEFYHDRSRKDGRANRCKLCDLKSKNVKQIGRTTEIKQRRKDGFAFCYTCRQWKPETEFAKRSNSVRRATNCRDCHRGKMGEWREKNRDKDRAAHKRYKAKDPVGFLQHARDWLKQTGKSREYNNRRRAKLNKCGGVITHKEWEALKHKYNYTCLCCGRKEPEIKLTLDHVIPLDSGGPNIIDNAQPLCGSCNSSKHTKSTDYR